MLEALKKKTSNITITTSKKKKIGFFSSILLVIGSCVGAGVFFKARYILNNVHQDFVLSIFAWVIAAIAVIAMSLALIEVASTSVKSDKGIMQWNKVFNGKWIYYASKNFMTFLYMPITYFFMPVYACQSLLEAIDSFGIGVDITKIPWWSILIVSIITNFWFIIVSGWSSRAGNIQSWIINSVKFVPMAVAAIIGFVILGQHGVLPEGIVLPGNEHINNNSPHMIQSINPSIGLFCSLSSIFFAYDGFYVAAGIQSQMKEPKKTPFVLVIGLSLVTIFYLLIAISSMVGSENGAWDGFKNAFNSSTVWRVFYGIFSIFIAFGVFGIVNSYAIWTPRFIESLIMDDEFFSYFSRYKHKINLSKPKIGIIISLILSIPVVIIFTLIGALGYMNVGGFDNVNLQVACLYSFADLSSSWTAVLVFMFICLSILGCLINRKTNKVKTKKTRLFIPMAIISLILISISLLFEVVSPFYSLAYTLIHYNSEQFSTLLASVFLIVVLILYLLGMVFPIIFDIRYEKKLKLSCHNDYIV